MTELTLFDYGQLDVETRITVKQRTEEIKTLVRRSAQDIIDIGNKLIDVKETLGHGGFGAWLDKEFGWSDSTALRFMQVGHYFKSVTVTDLSIQAKALYLLAAPSTPEPARIEAIERAKAGETITHTAAKEIVAQHRPPPPTSQPAPQNTPPTRTYESAIPAFTPPVDRRPPAPTARPLGDNEVEAVIWRAIAHHARIPDKATSAQQATAQLAWLQTAQPGDFSRLLNPNVSFEADQLARIKDAIETDLSSRAKPATQDKYDNDEYYTPDYILEPVRKVLGSIDLDPASCAIANTVAKAMTFYEKSIDGLLLPWRGNIWLNPPYSDPLPWIEKLFAEHEAGRLTAALVLTNTANSPKWARLLWQSNGSVCLLSSRIKFWRADQYEGKGFDRDQMIWYIGPTTPTNGHAKFRSVFGDLGAIR